mgnify:CR=1 FL=1
MLRVSATHKTILSLAAAVSMTTPVVVLADAANPEALSWARQKPKKKAAPKRAYRAKAVARPSAGVASKAAPVQPVPEAVSFGPPPLPEPAYVPPPAGYTPPPPPPAYGTAGPLAVSAAQATTPPLVYALIGAIIGAGVVLLLDDDDEDVVSP